MNTRILNLIAVFFCCAGLIIAGYLTFAHIVGADIPCRASGSGCQAIQNHPSSVLLGIPVAGYGFAGYLAILAFTVWQMLKGSSSALAKIVFGLSAFGAVVSIGLQVFAASVIHATCDWCLGSAGLMCGLFIVSALLLQRLPTEVESRTPVRKSDFALVAIFVLGAVIGLGAVSVSYGGGNGQALTLPTNGANELLVGAQSVGPVNAPITIVEFADLFCGSCQTSYSHMQKLQSEHPGKIRWVFRHFPLFTVKGHELALPTAIIAEHAAKQGKFWDFVTQIYAMNHESLKSIDDVLAVAKNANVDVSKAEAAINDENSPELKRVTEDINLAGKLGIMETPTFIMMIDGKTPVALRRRDLDTRMNTAEVQALLRK